MSSAEIAAANGAFQQASMARMSYASSISQGAIYGGQSGAGADAMMGAAMNRGAAIGGPLMGGAMGMLGLDPMSLGLRAGMSAFGAGAGLGGAALAGGAVALPMMAAGAAVNYGAQQMYQGANQQMELNNTLRGSFNFRNQQGGSGFNRGDMGHIGTMMRGMTEQFGPGGEIAGFGELTQLAGKMSSMGLAQGVRDVQEFSRRFKDMVSTLKGMAKDLGTTLEGAMEFAAAAKQSGVFGMSSVGRFTGAVRAASVGGGLAVSEVTGAASIGSQISRSIGGLGNQGAMAGIRTIGQIGAAQQMGVLSEQDIYNATGLTGAEGRQAFAASQLQHAGSFLQSGRGRRLLASMAGKNGTLDEGAVEQIMSGGMGIQETMANDRSHTTGAGGIGRANFIRNEGRLRGAALARFGAFLPAMQLQQWASSKGIDIQEMDDRSMLFAQRQLGMGRDELDAAVKMATNMPQILRTMKNSERSEDYFQGLAQQRKGQGISGVKQRYEQAREMVNNKLQKVGQDIFNTGGDLIENFFNDLMGTYVETYSKDIDESYRSMVQGGRGGARAFGIGDQGRSRFAGGSGGFSLAGRHGGASLAGQMNAGVSGGFWENVGGGAKSGAARGAGLLGFSGAELGGLGGALGGGASWILQGQSGVSKMQEQGFNLKGMSSEAIQAKLDSIENSRTAYATSGLMSMTADTRDKIRSAYVHGVGGAGDERMVSIQAALEQSDPVTAAKLRNARSPEEKAAIIGQVERAAGIGAGSGFEANYQAAGGIPGITSPGGFTGGASEENKAWARAMGAGSYGKTERAGGALGGTAAMMGVSAVLGPVGLVLSLAHGKGKESAATKLARAGTDLVARQTGAYQKEQAAGEFFKGKAFRDMAIGLMSADPAERAAARDRIEQAATDVGEKGENFEQYQKMLTAGESVEIMERTGGDKSKMTDLEKRKVEGSQATLGAMAGAVAHQQNRDRAEMERRLRVAGKSDLDKLAASGVYNSAQGVLTTDDSKLSPAARDALKRAITITKAEASGHFADESDYQIQATSLTMFSSSTLRSMAGKLAGTRQGEEMSYTAAMQDRVQRSMKKKGGLKGLLNQELGLGLDAASLKTMDENGLAALAGVTDPKAIQNLQAAMKSNNAGRITQAIKGLEADEGHQAKMAADKDKKNEENDPFGAAQVKESKKMNTYLEALVRSNKDASAQLEKIAASSGDANPENKPKAK